MTRDNTLRTFPGAPAECMEKRCVLSKNLGGCRRARVEYLPRHRAVSMERRKHEQRVSGRFAALSAGLLAMTALGVACSSDAGGDDPALGMGGVSGAAAAMGGAPAGMGGVAGMTQVGAGSGGFSAGGSAGSAGVSGVGGAGGVAGMASGGSGGSGGGGLGGASGEGGASGASGEGGMGGDGGMMMTGGAGGGPMSDACGAMPSDRTPPYMPVYRVPLRVHTTRSDLEREDLCGTLEEVNEIWWAQAGVCFEIEIVSDDEIADTGMDLWFERSAPFPNGVDANGVYSGAHEIYSLDEPSLNTAPNPVQRLPARTAAHELGHGLGLQHQNCGTACNDLLMTSGRRGFALVTGSPASTDELARARDRATDYALDDTAPTVCGAAVFRDGAP
jgi:hypothetical protein